MWWPQPEVIAARNASFFGVLLWQHARAELPLRRDNAGFMTAGSTMGGAPAYRISL